MANEPFYGMLCLGGTDGHLPDADGNSFPEIHLNLWEHEDQSFLDIGLRVSKEFPYNFIYLYLPWEARGIQSIVDLTPVITTASAIAAIFNESWEVKQIPGSTSAVVIDPTNHHAQFQIVSATRYLDIEPLEASHRLRIKFQQLRHTEKLQADDIYLRFRLKHVPRAFYAVGLEQGDRGLASSWTRNEFIDFRLNVRRGAPPDLESNVGRFLSFSKVHLFLMRNRSHELVFQDSAFRSCRSLEDESFWATYAHVGHTSPDEQTKKAYVADSLGYQWKKSRNDAGPVHEFGILARFKQMRFAVWQFIIAAIVIGALGDAAWDLLKWVWNLVSHSFDQGEI